MFLLVIGIVCLLRDVVIIECDYLPVFYFVECIVALCDLVADMTGPCLECVECFRAFFIDVAQLLRQALWLVTFSSFRSSLTNYDDCIGGFVDGSDVVCVFCVAVWA